MKSITPITIKICIVFFTLNMTSLIAEAQDENSTKSGTMKITKPRTEGQIFMIVDNLPTYPGGMKAMWSFLKTKINYPDSALDMGISGTVYVQMTISETGEATDVTVIRGIGGGCDEEAIRVVSTMPAWNPGSQRGKPVAVQYSIPIKFMLR